MSCIAEFVADAESYSTKYRF